MFMKDDGETTEKQRRKTSVFGYTRGRRVSKSSWPEKKEGYVKNLSRKRDIDII